MARGRMNYKALMLIYYYDVCILIYYIYRKVFWCDYQLFGLREVQVHSLTGNKSKIGFNSLSIYKYSAFSYYFLNIGSGHVIKQGCQVFVYPLFIIFVLNQKLYILFLIRYLYKVIINWIYHPVYSPYLL